jgi:hypothetical protein
MREKRLSIFVLVCFLEGSRNRGSVVKDVNRGSGSEACEADEAAAAEPLGFFCLAIAIFRDWRIEIFHSKKRIGYRLWMEHFLFLPGGVTD